MLNIFPFQDPGKPVLDGSGCDDILVITFTLDKQYNAALRKIPAQCHLHYVVTANIVL